MSLYFMSRPLWGAHVDPVNLTVGKAIAGLIEFIGPLMMIFNFKARWAAILIGSLFSFSALTGPFPFFHRRLLNPLPDVPFAIVPSMDVLLISSCAFFAFAYIDRLQNGEAREA